jgi:hypothetical protein
MTSWAIAVIDAGVAAGQGVIFAARTRSLAAVRDSGLSWIRLIAFAVARWTSNTP